MDGDINATPHLIEFNLGNSSSDITPSHKSSTMTRVRLSKVLGTFETSSFEALRRCKHGGNVELRAQPIWIADWKALAQFCKQLGESRIHSTCPSEWRQPGRPDEDEHAGMVNWVATQPHAATPTK